MVAIPVTNRSLVVVAVLTFTDVPVKIPAAANKVPTVAVPLTFTSVISVVAHVETPTTFKLPATSTLELISTYPPSVLSPLILRL